MVAVTTLLSRANNDWMTSMTINLTALSVAELESLAVQVQDEISAKKALAKKTLLADLERVARDAGVSLADLFGEGATKAVKVKKPVAAKYRNPSDSSQTWSGRGRQPLWLAALLAEGKKLEELEL
ncbi:UNVERIFIED_CONTAM: hvrA [Trichonephila clavipes]